MLAKIAPRFVISRVIQNSYLAENQAIELLKIPFGQHLNHYAMVEPQNYQVVRFFGYISSLTKPQNFANKYQQRAYAEACARFKNFNETLDIYERIVQIQSEARTLYNYVERNNSSSNLFSRHLETDKEFESDVISGVERLRKLEQSLAPYPEWQAKVKQQIGSWYHLIHNNLHESELKRSIFNYLRICRNISYDNETKITYLQIIQFLFIIKYWINYASSYFPRMYPILALIMPKFDFFYKLTDFQYLDNLTQINQKMNQDDPQSCTKCGCMPQDILMLACSHDLCLNCAAQVLSIEMKKNKNTNVIVCQECQEKTPLDIQSINVLKSLIKPSTIKSKAYDANPNSNSKYQEPTTYDRPSRNAPQQKIADKYSYDKPGNGSISYDRTDRNNPAKSKIATVDAFQGISSKKTCTEHHEQQILYFCFDCKCECICPQCIIHGKHKDHDVKTIRKAQPLVKAQVDKYVQLLDRNVQTLLIKKSQAEKQIRSLTEQNNLSKKQIQQAFEDLRARINQQEKEILSRCDQNLSDGLTQLDRTAKQIVKRIDELKSYTVTMGESTRKDQILFLNYYSRKHKELQQESRQPEVSLPAIQIPSNQSVLSSILDINDQVTRVGATPRAANKK